MRLHVFITQSPSSLIIASCTCMLHSLCFSSLSLSLSLFLSCSIVIDTFKFSHLLEGVTETAGVDSYEDSPKHTEQKKYIFIRSTDNDMAEELKHSIASWRKVYIAHTRGMPSFRDSKFHARGDHQTDNSGEKL